MSDILQNKASTSPTTKQDFYNDMQVLEKLKLKGKLSDYGQGCLDAMHSYSHLVFTK